MKGFGKLECAIEDLEKGLESLGDALNESSPSKILDGIGAIENAIEWIKNFIKENDNGR